MKYATTYEIWDTESLEAGETDDKGFNTEWTECTFSDIWDLAHDWKNAQNNNNGSYTQEVKINFRTGEQTISTLHFQDADLELIDAIFTGKINRNALDFATNLQEVQEYCKAFDAEEVIARLEELLQEAEDTLSSGVLVPAYSLSDVMRIESLAL